MDFWPLLPTLEDRFVKIYFRIFVTKLMTASKRVLFYKCHNLRLANLSLILTQIKIDHMTKLLDKILTLPL